MGCARRYIHLKAPSKAGVFVRGEGVSRPSQPPAGGLASTRGHIAFWLSADNKVGFLK